MLHFDKMQIDEHDDNDDINFDTNNSLSTLVNFHTVTDDVGLLRRVQSDVT